jgi:hypothetical protein
MWPPAPGQRTSKTVGSGDSQSNTNPPPAPAWKNSHYHPSCYEEDDFERLFLPGDDSIQSFRVNFSGQSWYSNPTPCVYESNAMVHPHIATKGAAGYPSSFQTCSLMKQQQHYDAFDTEMKVEEAQIHGGDCGNHDCFVSSVLEYPLLYNDEEEVDDTGLDDQDRWELKLLFSTLHNSEDQSRKWLPPLPTTGSESGCSSYSKNKNSSNPTSIHMDPLCCERTTPDHVNSTDFPTGPTTATNSSCDEGPQPPYDSTTPHRRVPSPKDPPLKPILTSSRLETVGDCCMSNASLAHAQPDGNLENAEAAKCDSPVGDNCSSTSSRFRIYQEDQWMEQYRELQEFTKETGHTFVPCGYPDRDSLARWTKRQRYQYKLRMEGKVSTMTKERIALLDQLGFIWNSQVTVWEKRLSELKQYKRLTGHCNVPSHFAPNQKLATWVKCQRRQYKLLTTGRKSNMTIDRAKILENLGFVWELRCHPQRTESCSDRHYKY